MQHHTHATHPNKAKQERLMQAWKINGQASTGLQEREQHTL